MVGSAAERDDRAVSEVTSVAILVGFTVVVTASVGVGVLVMDDSEGGVPSATFDFEHYTGNGMLVVRHEGGDPVPAGRLVLSGPPGSVTWAEIANANETAAVEADQAIQLSDNNAWGESVSSADTVEVFYRDDGGNQTLLESWSG